MNVDIPENYTIQQRVINSLLLRRNNSKYPVDFENGLAGIGWGIEYLVQNSYIEADTDEVLEEFDNRIFKE